jgi:hypothetical protein
MVLVMERDMMIMLKLGNLDHRKNKIIVKSKIKLNLIIIILRQIG